ncbi:hypothetical protein BGZ83_011538 [Gryganskiella cystojenkinii]|nr:hypothetical protein BGZ83_011538 [Gryganskiella cystojenkinii]
MTFNFDGSSFGMDQAGLDLALNDFSFDPSSQNRHQLQDHLQQQQHQQQQQQQQLQQQQQQQNQHQELHSLMMHDSHSAANNGFGTQAMDHDTSTSSPFDFHTSMTTDVLASASTTPIFPTNPDKINHQSLQQQLQQQQFLQQQQQQQKTQHFHNQHNQQLQQQQQQASQQEQLLTPANNDYFNTDYSQYMSPHGIQADTSDAAMIITDQFDDDEVFFTPLISPAMTPSHPYSNMPHALSTANEIFSPLTSPALQPIRSSTNDYLSFSGQSFTPLPMQFHQSQSSQQQQQQQQQIQHQLQQMLPMQPMQTQDLQQQQQQANSDLQQQLQQIQSSPALNSQRPPIKRKSTVERGATGLNSPRSVGPVRALPKSSPAMRPMASPMSPATLRKQSTSRARSSAIAPPSPLIMHFPTNRPSPSPLLISTSQPLPLPQASPSPRLVTNMHQLSMMPASPMGLMGNRNNNNNGPKSPALFALPASSMMPPPQSPLIMPSSSSSSKGNNNTPRQLISGPTQQVQIQSQHQLSIHQPIIASPALKPASENNNNSNSNNNNSSNGNKESNGGSNQSDTSIASATGASMVASSPKSALAPVTPASLMNLGAGSGSELTPTSSPKFGGVHAAKAAKSAAAGGSNLATSTPTLSPNQAETSGPNSTTTSSPSSSATTATTTQKRGTKRQANGSATPVGSGVLAPSTPRQVPLTPGGSTMSPMPPPANGFSLISPALKPTLMPQGHRGSTQLLVSPRLQPHLSSPSLKPWIAGVSTNEVMARLTSKSNYQNILDGDHTALGLSYNTDLHSGIEQRRTSHKAAEQKRRDSLKNCFDDLRQMIPNIQEKSPSKVFLLKKSFDYLCNLKADVARRDLEIAQLKAQQSFMQSSMQAWFAALPEDSPFKQLQQQPQGESKNLLESWKMPEEEVKKATVQETETLQRAITMTELSAAAVEAARTMPGGQTKGGGDDSDDEGSPIKTKKNGGRSGSSQPSSSKSKKSSSSAAKGSNATSTATGVASSSSTNDSGNASGSAPQTSSAQGSGPSSSTAFGSKDGENDGADDMDDDDDEDENEDQEMADATT